MTEEEIQALREAKEAAEKAAAEANAAALAAKEEAEKAIQTRDNLVEELKTERQKKQEALSKANINNGELDVNAQIEAAFEQREAARRKAEFETAIAEFKSSKPEFQADAAGLVFGKFQETLKKFNFSDIATKEQARARLEEVYRFANGTSSTPTGDGHDGTPNAGVSVPTSDKSKQEIAELAQKAGMPEDKVISLRSKYPDALSGLGM